MAKKQIPQIIKEIRAFQPKEVDWANEKLISFSQLSMYLECPKKWSLQYVEGHKQFTSSIHTVFGSALHVVIQDYLTTMYDESIAAANKMNTSELFEDELRTEYKKQYKSNNNQHFLTPEELREFYEDGIEIIRYFAKNVSKYFSKKGWYLIGCEIPVALNPNPQFPNVRYQGYLDAVLYHEPTNTIKIIDFKTSGYGWRDREKKDKVKQLQLILYKKFLSDQFNFPIDNIEIEYVILKRKIPEESDFVIKRIQLFSPSSGKVKVKQALQHMDDFINNAFTLSGYKKTEHECKTSDKCKWCPFYQTHLCSATY